MNRISAVVMSVILLPIIVWSCSKDNGYDYGEEGAAGSGNVVNYKVYDGDGVRRVIVKTNADIIIRQGGRTIVEAESDDNLQQWIRAAASGETLYITTSKKLRPTRIKIYITAPSGSFSVALNGKGNISNEGNLGFDSFGAEINGTGDIIISRLESEVSNLHISNSGNISMTGKGENVHAEIEGRGNIGLMNFTADRADYRLAGAGNIEACASRSLRAEINGSGNVFYRGNPVRKIVITGYGNVFKK